jgi:hypothetical protein
MTDDELKSTAGVWCVVANVKREHPFGERGIETKSGTKQFRGGTKVYIGGCYAELATAWFALGCIARAENS